MPTLDRGSGIDSLLSLDSLDSLVDGTDQLFSFV